MDSTLGVETVCVVQLAQWVVSSNTTKFNKNYEQITKESHDGALVSVGQWG